MLTVRTLASHGLTTLDTIAGTPLDTLQRILGTAAGRQLHQRAAGIDPTRVARAPRLAPFARSTVFRAGRTQLRPAAPRPVPPGSNALASNSVVNNRSADP